MAADSHEHEHEHENLPGLDAEVPPEDGRKRPPAPPLTAEQRTLVNDNLGLIAVHLKRFVSGLSVPRRDREWEDLFQEGAMGLMAAARSFDPTRGIPFAAYALPRIHNAVSRALERKFNLVYVPPKRKPKAPAGKKRRDVSEDEGGRASRGKRGAGRDQKAHIAQSRRGSSAASDAIDGDAASALRANPARRPKEFNLSEDAAHAIRDRRDPSAVPLSGDTLGSRLRAKYERAAHAVAEDMASRGSTRGDRHVLVKAILHERLLVPSEESRRALRQIARDTKSSYARVAQCDKQIVEEIRARLETDPEFVELSNQSRASDDGMNTAVDPRREAKVMDASCTALLRRVGRADTSVRGELLDALFEGDEPALDRMVRVRFPLLPEERRERVHLLIAGRT